jgi:hypothetical protein
MNFQGYLEDTYKIIKKEPIILIAGGILVQILNAATFSVLAGPLFGGYLLMILLTLRDNQKPAFNDLFNGFQQIGLLFPYFFVLLAKAIGFMLFIIPGIILSTWWIYVLPLMVDRKIGFSEAMRISTNKVNETGFLMHMIFLLLVYVIPIVILNMLFALIPFLFAFALSLLLMPFQVGCITSLYLDQFKELEEKTDAGQQEKATAVTPVIKSPAEKIELKVEEDKKSPQAAQAVSEESEITDLDVEELTPEKGIMEEKLENMNDVPSPSKDKTDSGLVSQNKEDESKDEEI